MKKILLKLLNRYDKFTTLGVKQQCQGINENNYKIPVSVIVVTKNEGERIERCLASLSAFDDVWVVDSDSSDETQAIALSMNANVVNFVWDGQYPKKRQRCLNNLDLAYYWVFFVDADEVLTEDLVEEIRALDFKAAGYFVKGRYVFEGKALRFGLRNNKLALFDRRCIEFPVVNDLGILGMGEIEGHYQPVLMKGHLHEKIVQLKASLLHYAYEDINRWNERHKRYALWEKEINKRQVLPHDKRLLKKVFKLLPFQASMAFLYSYILKLGFFDGARGFRFAQSRWRYYKMIDIA
ncbi:MAG: glycosyltransferase family 2 protein [Alphaproteobacteria bacterium]|nr:glycosyltransferase family 2 protein [Alphaproteobacteria bacterium]